jgi:hypothetical protein
MRPFWEPGSTALQGIARLAAGDSDGQDDDVPVVEERSVQPDRKSPCRVFECKVVKGADGQVAVPYIHRWVWRNQPLPLLMLREGMAVVYTSGGSEYGPWGLDGMQAVEAEAK